MGDAGGLSCFPLAKAIELEESVLDSLKNIITETMDDIKILKENPHTTSAELEDKEEYLADYHKQQLAQAAVLSTLYSKLPKDDEQAMSEDGKEAATEEVASNNDQVGKSATGPIATEPTQDATVVAAGKHVNAKRKAGADDSDEEEPGQSKTLRSVSPELSSGEVNDQTLLASTGVNPALVGQGIKFFHFLDLPGEQASSTKAEQPQPLPVTPGLVPVATAVPSIASAQIQTSGQLQFYQCDSSFQSNGMMVAPATRIVAVASLVDNLSNPNATSSVKIIGDQCFLGANSICHTGTTNPCPFHCSYPESENSPIRKSTLGVGKQATLAFSSLMRSYPEDSDSVSQV